METIIILVILVILTVIIVLFLRQRVQQQEYTFKVESGKCARLKVSEGFSSLGTNQHFTCMVPKTVGEEITSTNYGQRIIGINQALVIYGKIPYQYLTWSIAGVEFNDKAYRYCTKTISDLQAENNDEVAAVMCTSKLIFKNVSDNLNKLWKQSSSAYKLNIVPLYIRNYDFRREYTLVFKTGKRHTDDYDPKLQYMFYDFTDIPLSKPETVIESPTYSTTNETRIAKSDVFEGSITRMLKQNNFKVIRKLQVNIVEDGLNVVHFKTPNVMLTHGQTLMAFGIDHCRSLKAKYSTLTVYNKDDSGLSTLITGDYDVRNYPVEGLQMTVLKYSTPGEVYVMEEIGTYFGRKISWSSCYPFYAVVVSTLEHSQQAIQLLGKHSVL